MRLETPRHPLIGESPIEAAALDLMASGAISQQQISFYMNRARPAFVLSTDQILTSDQATQLRELWEK